MTSSLSAMTEWVSLSLAFARHSMTSSTVDLATNLITLTGRVCPIRWARAAAWRSTWENQLYSENLHNHSISILTSYWQLLYTVLQPWQQQNMSRMIERLCHSVTLSFLHTVLMLREHVSVHFSQSLDAVYNLRALYTTMRVRCSQPLFYFRHAWPHLPTMGIL